MERFWRWTKTSLLYALATVATLFGVPATFAMADEVTTAVLTLDEATEYIAAKTLRTALFQLAAYQFAEKHKLPTREGRTFSLTRYEPVNLPQNPLSQGVTPANTPMSVSRVQAVAEQWGAVITIYDVPQLTLAHDVLQKAIKRLGEQAAKVYERESQRAMLATTNNQFANAKTSRDLLVATDYITSLEIRKAVTNLRKNGTAKWRRSASNTPKSYIERMQPEGGGTTAAKPGMDAQYSGLIGIVDTDVAQDLSNDSTFVNAASYSNIRALHVNELGMWLGVVWIESNFMPQLSLLASPTTAGANMTGFAGGLAGGTAYDFKVTRVAKSYGLEEAISAKIDQSTGGGDDAVSVVLPANTAFMYRIYAGADAGTMYAVPSVASAVGVTANDITGPYFEGGQTVIVTAIPTSGDTAPVTPATGVTVHVTWIFGDEAFGCVELDRLEATLTPNEASDSDPLKQRRKAGWKSMFKCVVQNSSYIRKLESASAFAG